MDAKSPRNSQARIAYLSALVNELKVRYRAVKHRLNRFCKRHKVSYFELATENPQPRYYTEMVRLSNYIYSCWSELTKLVCPKHPLPKSNSQVRDALKDETKLTNLRSDNQFDLRPLPKVELKEERLPYVGALCESRQYFVRLENRVSELEASLISVKREKGNLQGRLASSSRLLKSSSRIKYERVIEKLVEENDSLSANVAALQSKVNALNALANAPRKVKPRKDRSRPFEVELQTNMMVVPISRYHDGIGVNFSYDIAIKYHLTDGSSITYIPGQREYPKRLSYEDWKKDHPESKY